MEKELAAISDAESIVSTYQIVRLVSILAVAYFVWRGPIKFLIRFIRKLKEPDNSSEVANINRPNINGSQNETTSKEASLDNIVKLAKQLGGEKSATIMEYSDEALDAYSTIRNLETEYHEQFFKHIEANGVNGIGDYAQKLFDDYVKTQNPFISNICNQYYNDLKEISDEAAAEFRRAIEALGEDADVASIEQKVRAKFINDDSGSPQYFVKSHGGQFYVVDQDNKFADGTKYYMTKNDAEDVAQHLASKDTGTVHLSPTTEINLDSSATQERMSALKKDLSELKKRG